MNFEPVVHTLLYGQSLCGFSADVPANWPSGHRWTEMEDLDHITCPDCKSEAEKIIKASGNDHHFPDAAPESVEDGTREWEEDYGGD